MGESNGDKPVVWKVVAMLAVAGSIGGGTGHAVSSQTVGVKIAQLETKVEAMQPYGERLRNLEKEVTEIGGAVKRIEENQNDMKDQAKKESEESRERDKRLQSIQQKLGVLVDRNERE